jgi:undecaprenyl-diphosphatase
MNPFQAAVLGLVEGLTEYLPVSSTGHLIIAGKLLGLEGEGTKSFEIVIQLGAILAVLVYYRKLLIEKARMLIAPLSIAFLPAAVLGLAARKAIKAHLFTPWAVAGALIVGGVVMIAVERVRKARKIEGESGLDKIDAKRALLIGLGQCVSLWPGSSRSMCTIVAGQLAGLSTATAAEFSFLLALPTLGAATLYEGFKARHELLAGGGVTELGIGLVVSFVVAWAVIAGFLAYLKKRGLEPFGVYRIVAGAAVLFLMR